MLGGQSSVTLRLPARPTAVAEARNAVRETCRHLPERTLDDATLLVSELVTNAIRYAGGMITVAIDCDEDHIAIAVGDHSTEQPVIRDPDDDDTNGRGLRLVDALATRWGCKPASDNEGKTIWFSLP
jgi:anti-sigma regulatory factor (Ser/Thr protein kinase)